MSEGEKKKDAEPKKGLLGRMFGARNAPADSTDEDMPNASERTPAPAQSDPQTPPADLEQDTDQRGWFGRLKDGLSKSSNRLGDGITGIFTKRKLDEDTLQELEDILIQADLGVDTATRITDLLAESRLDKDISTSEVQEVLAQEVQSVLEPVARPLEIDTQAKPFVILMAGVNGAGKTTTIGKLSHKYAAEGKKVMLAAGDTFRAAAVEQLAIWGERTGAPVIQRDIGSDAASLAYDAMMEAKNADIDILMMDTAGRLQNKTHLMDELKKIVRVMKKLDEEAPHAVLLVLDATTGQKRPQPDQGFWRSGRCHGARHDQARWISTRRHSRGHCRSLQIAGAFHWRWRGCGRFTALQGR